MLTQEEMTYFESLTASEYEAKKRVLYDIFISQGEFPEEVYGRPLSECEKFPGEYDKFKEFLMIKEGYKDNWDLFLSCLF